MDGAIYVSFGFDLADAFAGDVELFADFFQRVVGVHFDTETHAQHFRFAWRERVQIFLWSHRAGWRYIAESDGARVA